MELISVYACNGVRLPTIHGFSRIQKLRFQESIHPQNNLHFFIHSYPILALYLGTQLSFIILQHTHLLIPFVLIVFFNRVCIVFSLTVSILTQCLPQIWDKFALNPAFVDDALLQPKIRQQKIQLNRLQVQSIIKHSQSNSITIIKDSLNSSRKQASKVINQRQVTCWYHLILLVGVVDQVAFVCCLHKSHIHFSWGEMWPSFAVSINHIFIYLGEKYE